MRPVAVVGELNQPATLKDESSNSGMVEDAASNRINS